MEAVVYTQYGSPDVLQLMGIEKPTPKEDEVLIRIHAASVNAYDWHMLRAKPFIARFVSGLFKPKNKILGADFAGNIEAVGRNIQQYHSGDEVYGCRQGSLAEYMCSREDRLAMKPINLSFEQAAAAPMAALTALQALRDVGHIHSGHKVLINGAGGGVGTFAVQIAKSFGAEVTAVCSTRNLDMARSIGADHVIDYTKEDFTKSGQRYDLILGANGYHSLFDYKRALSLKGIYVMSGGTNAQMFQSLLGPLVSFRSGKRLDGVAAKVVHKDLVFIKELLEAGKVVPVIDRRYPLNQVPDAIRYLEEGHAQGKVVITMRDRL
jgi:NADPH:quinone reductase-like Zn-dependent oxidoreductase